MFLADDVLNSDVLNSLESIDNTLLAIYGVIRLVVTVGFLVLVVYFIVKFFLDLFR